MSRESSKSNLDNFIRHNHSLQRTRVVWRIETEGSNSWPLSSKPLCALEENMNVKTLLDLCKKFQEEHITVWFDGGWGVDALMGFQTRHHDDLDLVVEEGSLEKLVQLLRKIGYDDVPRDDTRAWNFVLGDENGSLVDIHVININANGDGIYGPPENGEAYPAKALTGKGVINGEEVKCLTPEYQVLNHIGYELKEKDHKDVKNLCDKFNIALPITLETPHRENDT